MKRRTTSSISQPPPKIAKISSSQQQQQQQPPSAFIEHDNIPLLSCDLLVTFLEETTNHKATMDLHDEIETSTITNVSYENLAKAKYINYIHTKHEYTSISSKDVMKNIFAKYKII